jgi:hypothetical protein
MTLFRETHSDTVVEFGLNAKIAKARVVITYSYDSDFTADRDFDSPEEKEKFLDDFRLGRLTPIVIFVKAYALGQTGQDVLGGSVVKDYKEVDGIVKDHDMINNAIDELKTHIHSLISQLQPYMDRS